MALTIEETKQKVVLYEAKEKDILLKKEQSSKEIAVLESQIQISAEKLKIEFGNIDNIDEIVKNLDEEAQKLEAELAKIEASGK